MKKILVILSLALMLLGSCSHNGGEVTFDGKWITHEGTNYELSYPETWQITTISNSTVDVIFRSPKESGDDPFLENFNIILQDINDMSLEEYTKLSVAQINEFINEAEILSNEENTINGNTCYTIIYTGKPGALNLQYRQDYYIVNGIAYVVTFTSEQSRFEDYQSISEKIFNSFEIR